jgi:hypothetical protein
MVKKDGDRNGNSGRGSNKDQPSRTERRDGTKKR